MCMPRYFLQRDNVHASLSPRLIPSRCDTLFTMMTRAARPVSGSRQTLLHVAFLVVFVLIAQQVVANVPRNPTPMPMASADAQMALNAQPCGGMCASAIVHLCLPASRVCAAIIATFTHVPVFALLILALIALIAVAAPTRAPIVAFPSWLWPPERRRALFQVFLI